MFFVSGRNKDLEKSFCLSVTYSAESIGHSTDAASARQWDPKLRAEDWAKAVTSKNPAINIGAKEMLSGLAIQISGGGETGLNDLGQVSILQILPKCAPLYKRRDLWDYLWFFGRD